MSAPGLGLRYFAGVFAAGFVLGTVRIFWLGPAIGEVAAVAAELPVMLAIAAWWCRRLLRGTRLAAGQRLVMGGTAFLCLMVAELGLSLALGGTLATHLAALLAPAGLMGLAGQLVFAALPLLLPRVMRTK